VVPIHAVDSYPPNYCEQPSVFFQGFFQIFGQPPFFCEKGAASRIRGSPNDLRPSTPLREASRINQAEPKRKMTTITKPPNG
jgi:hypothetical protein